ncbi:hypothetical protein LRR80_06061 [Streptomyces sp. RO-S4]|nr:hypothetical protein [Streptomyces sp. RO-S4]
MHGGLAPTTVPPELWARPATGADRVTRVAGAGLRDESDGMTIQITRLSDPAVRAFVAAVNNHDREAFTALLAPGATMADDGTERDLAEWTDREIFSSHGHMEVDNESDGGRRLVARYSNDTWGEMRTSWSFTVDDDGRISRFETGQA